MEKGTAGAYVQRRRVSLRLDDGRDARRRAILATAGVLADAPDWPEWLAEVRGSGADERLRRLGR